MIKKEVKRGEEEERRQNEEEEGETKEGRRQGN